MKKLKFVLLLLLYIFALDSCAFANPKRIVSLSPVGTEILFALGQENNIIAVTNFCDYPKEALLKPKIGDFASLNYEALLLMKTDLLVLQDMHMQFTPELNRLKIPYVILEQESIKDVCNSIEKLGKICGVPEKSAVKVKNIQNDINSIKKTLKGKKKSKVLVCVSRELSGTKVTNFYAAGTKTFYNELIELSGGYNAVTEKRVSYPQISMEGLSKLNPDVIIDLVGDSKYYHSKDEINAEVVFNEKYLKDQWQKGAGLSASMSEHITVLFGTVYLRPGCRIGLILKSFAKAIHPEVKW